MRPSSSSFGRSTMPFTTFCVSSSSSSSFLSPPSRLDGKLAVTVLSSGSLSRGAVSLLTTRTSRSAPSPSSGRGSCTFQKCPRSADAHFQSRRVERWWGDKTLPIIFLLPLRRHRDVYVWPFFSFPVRPLPFTPPPPRAPTPTHL